jgi:hypothetical protein
MIAMIVVMLVSSVERLGSVSPQVPSYRATPQCAAPHMARRSLLSTTTPTHVRHFGSMRACHVVIVSCKVLAMADTLADGKRIVQPYPCLTPPQAYTASVT